MAKTTYRILVRTEDGHWAEGGDVTANGAKAARMQYVEGKTFDVLTIVAIPIRSWQPKTRRTTTTTTEDDAQETRPRRAETASTGG